MPVPVNHAINRIVYIDAQGQLNTISPSGADQRLLTQTDLRFQFPAWSSDGAHLASIGGDEHGAGVFVTSDQNYPTEPKTVYYSTDQRPFYLYWAPDSHRIGFIASHPPNDIGLYLASVADEGTRLLTTGQPLFWDWASDSKQILVHSGKSHLEARLALINLENNKVRENSARPGPFQAPSFSAGGRYRAFAEADAYDNGQLVVEEIASQKRMVVPYEGVVAFSWCASQAKLAFVAPPLPAQRFYGALHLLDPVNEHIKVLAEATILAFFWSPDGSHIVYLTLANTPSKRPGQTRLQASLNGQRNGIYRKSRAGQPLSESVSSLPTDTLTLNLHVVNTITGHHYQLATFTPPPLFINQFLPFFDQYALSHRLWAPDSQQVIFPVIDKGIAQITIFPIDGKPSIPVAEGQIAFWSKQ